MAAGSIIIDMALNTGSVETDSKRAEASLKKIIKAFSDLRGGTAQVAEVYDSLGKASKQLVIGNDSLTNSVKTVEMNYKTLRAEMDRVATQQKILANEAANLAKLRATRENELNAALQQRMSQEAARTAAQQANIARAAAEYQARQQALNNEMNRGAVATTNLNNGLQKSHGAFRASNQIIQQASYQVTDFVVQVSGGVSAMRAFSQQAPQLLGAFGAAGAALGVVAALGGAVGDLIMKSMNVKTVKDAFDDLEDATSKLNGALSLTTQIDLSSLGKNYREATVEGKKLIDANIELALLMSNMSKIDATAAFREGLRRSFEDIGFFTKAFNTLVNSVKYSRMDDVGGFVTGPTDIQQFADINKITLEQANAIDKAQKAFGNAEISAGDLQKVINGVVSQYDRLNSTFTQFVETTNKGAIALEKQRNLEKQIEQARKNNYTGLESAGARGRSGMSEADRLAKQELASAQKFVDTLKLQTDQLAFQATLIGRNTQEVELLNSQYRIQAELEKTIQDMQRQGIDISAANLAKMNEAAASAIAAQAAIITATQERQRDSTFGMGESIRKYTDNASNMAKNMEGAFNNAFKGMEDGLTQFALTGKASFADFANAVLADIMRIQIRMMLAGLIQNVAGGYFSTTPGTSSNPAYQGPPSAPARGYAEGGYTGDGGKYDAAGIVHKGEFVMSKAATSRIGVGALNRMLKGYSDGGYVGATPTGGGGDVSIVVNNNSSNAQATATTSTDAFGNRQIEIMVADMVNKAIATGKTDSAMRSAYNLRRSGK